MRKKTLTLCLLFISTSLVHGHNSPVKCSLTTKDMLGLNFVSGAPTTRAIAPKDEMTPDNAVIFTGKILDRSCKPINGALVDVWYAGGANTHYSFPKDDYLWYRGKQIVDSSGIYEFQGTFPGSYPIRPITHVHFKVTTRKIEFVTMMYFRGLVPHEFDDYVMGRDSQFPQTIVQDSEGRKITFDMVLDL